VLPRPGTNKKLHLEQTQGFVLVAMGTGRASAPLLLCGHRKPCEDSGGSLSLFLSSDLA
jgi:hypothetical protein